MKWSRYSVGPVGLLINRFTTSFTHHKCISIGLNRMQPVHQIPPKPFTKSHATRSPFAASSEMGCGGGCQLPGWPLEEEEEQECNQLPVNKNATNYLSTGFQKGHPNPLTWSRAVDLPIACCCSHFVSQCLRSGNLNVPCVSCDRYTTLFNF